MKQDITTFVGLLFLGFSIAMFGLWFHMAIDEKEVVGLKAWYIIGAAIFGVTLIVMPQEKLVKLITDFLEGAFAFIFRKKDD